MTKRIESVNAYPLDWPADRARTKYPEPFSRFTCTLDSARWDVREELRRLGASRVIMSTNRPLRQDGEFYANSSEPMDSGVAVWFEFRGRTMVFACDGFVKMRDNLRAIAKTIEALRRIERYGVGEAMERAFSGFEALPAPATGHRPWYDVLGVAADADVEEIRAAKGRLAKRFHPDTGGPEASHERMAEVNAAAGAGLARAAAHRKEGEE